MPPTEWDQLNHRLDEQFAHLHERLDALQSGLQALEQSMEERFNHHNDYHKENEPHWGPERLAQLHPFRTALAAAILTLFFLALKPDSIGSITRFVVQWLEQSR